jgi:hypothetical protein
MCPALAETLFEAHQADLFRCRAAVLLFQTETYFHIDKVHGRVSWVKHLHNVTRVISVG